MSDTADVNYAIIRLARAHRHRAGMLLGRLGLHPGQEVVLTMLAAQDGRSATDLAAGACVEPGTMSRTLASLERAGYLIRQESTSDRRAVQVTLTSKGRAVQADVDTAWQELARQTTAGLTATDRRTLLDLVARVSANLARRRNVHAPATRPTGVIASVAG